MTQNDVEDLSDELKVISTALVNLMRSIHVSNDYGYGSHENIDIKAYSVKENMWTSWSNFIW